MNGLNGFQREAQWRPDPIDTLASELLSSSSSWHTTQSLSRNASLRMPPSVATNAFSSATLPSSFSHRPRALTDLQSPDSSTSSLSTPSPFASSLLPPPPVPSRSRSQEMLRASPGPFQTDPLPIRPSSTNPFTGPLAPQHRRSLTPDFSFHHQTPAANLQSTASALAQPLVPTLATGTAPAGAPVTQLSGSMSLFGPPPSDNPTVAPQAAPMSQLSRSSSVLGSSSTNNPSHHPLLPRVSSPSLGPALPLAPPSSLPPTLAPHCQQPPTARRWVTFDDDSDFLPQTKTPQYDFLSPAPLAPQTQTQLSHSVFEPEPEWLSSVPAGFPTLSPSAPSRTVTSNPKLPEGPNSNCFFPRESTER